MRPSPGVKPGEVFEAKEKALLRRGFFFAAVPNIARRARMPRAHARTHKTLSPRRANADDEFAAPLPQLKIDAPERDAPQSRQHENVARIALPRFP